MQSKVSQTKLDQTRNIKDCIKPDVNKFKPGHFTILYTAEET